MDALRADGGPAEHQAERAGGRRAGEEGEFGRQAPHLGAMRRDIGGGAEEGGMAEGEEPDIADEEIEGAGEEREAQRLHEEDRVEEEGGNEREADEGEGQETARGE